MGAWVRRHGHPLVRHARGGGHPEKGQKHWVPTPVITGVKNPIFVGADSYAEMAALQGKPALLSAYLLKTFQKRKKSQAVSPRKTQNIIS